MPELRKYQCCECGYEEERVDFVDGVDCPHCAGFMYPVGVSAFQEYHTEPKSEVVELGDKSA